MSHWPKHNNPKGEERTAHAPYNFVPLPDKIQAVAPEDLPAHDVFRPDTLTGRIEVKLTTASPLYVRCGWSPEDFDKYGKKSFADLPPDLKQKMAEFFHSRSADRPVIPGSSLRGMLRAMVEIVSYGKVQPVTDKPTMFFRAVAAPKSDPLSQPYQDALGKYGANVRAGYLVKKGEDWFVKPALLPKDIGLSVRDVYLKVKERQIQVQTLPGFLELNNPNYTPQIHKVSFSVEIRKDKRGKAYASVTKIGPADANYVYQGMLVCSGNMLETNSSGQRSPRKNHALVLKQNERAPLIKINRQAVEDYLAGATDFQKESPPFDSSMGCLIEDNPVFYIEEKGEIFLFGHTPNFRVPMRLANQKRATTPIDFLPKELYRKTDVDFTEAVFGYTKDNDLPEGITRAYAGRVFVSDAQLNAPATDIFLQKAPLIPKILSGPKPTTFQHYLTQQQPEMPAQLDYYAGSAPHETVVRGHKLYWHKGSNPALANDKKDAKESQLTQIKPLKPGVAFTFTIHFENLRELELGALLWVLNLGANPNYRLKLGMGKPLGMGAIQTEPTLHLVDRSIRYKSLFNDDAWQLGPRDDSAATAKAAASAFEAFIRNNHTDAFGGDGRIEQLLALLSWPGPDPNNTQYMELDEFKKRKVLPTPQNVLTGITGQAEPPKETNHPQQPVRRSTSTPGRPKKASTVTVPSDNRIVAPEDQPVSPPSRPKKPQSPQLPQPGQVFTGKVFEILHTGTVLVELKGTSQEEGFARISEDQIGTKQYRVGNPAKCEVIEINRVANQWIVDCKPASKREK